MVYTNVDELGTYCVMDMELWLNSFDVPEEEYQSTPMLMSLYPEDEAVSEFTEEDTRMTFDGEAEDMTPGRNCFGRGCNAYAGSSDAYVIE